MYHVVSDWLKCMIKHALRKINSADLIFDNIGGVSGRANTNATPLYSVYVKLHDLTKYKLTE